MTFLAAALSSFLAFFFSPFCLSDSVKTKSVAKNIRNENGEKDGKNIMYDRIVPVHNLTAVVGDEAHRKICIDISAAHMDKQQSQRLFFCSSLFFCHLICCSFDFDYLLLVYAFTVIAFEWCATCILILALLAQPGAPAVCDGATIQFAKNSIRTKPDKKPFLIRHFNLGESSANISNV